jgi:hypothetical protein
MWAEVAQIVDSANCTLSVYADDLTISGSVVPEASIWEIKKVVHKHGHRYNADKERSKCLKPAEITGVILNSEGRGAPNRQHKALYELRCRLIRGEDTGSDCDHVKAQLRGREAQMYQVTSKT